MWNFRDFPGFYSAVTTRDRSDYYNIWEGWRTYFEFYLGGGLGGIRLYLNPWRDDGIHKAWKYDMCRLLVEEWPEQESILFNYFTKFQRKIFNRIAPWWKENKILDIHVTCANIEVEGNKPKSPHYLIHLVTPRDPKLIDPIPLLNGITDATASRAMGFFYIYKYIKFY